MGRCYNSIVIEAPAEKVWSTIQDFHNLDWGSEVITQVDNPTGKSGNEVGAKRVLNGVFHETLTAFDADAMTFSYSIDDGPEPVASNMVSNYVGTVRIRPVTNSNHTFIEWESTYESNSDDAIAEFCNPIYAALLAALKRHLGG